MLKRGQVSLFIIIGLIILLVTGLLIISRNPPQANSGKIELQQEGLFIQSYVGTCLREKLVEAESFGLNNDVNEIQSEYIEAKLRECADLSQFNKNGLEIHQSAINTEIRLSDEIFSAKTTYPITISRKGGTISFQNFNEYIKRESSTAFSQDQTEVTEPTILLSGDKNAEIKIEAGTKATRDGSAISGMSIRMLDKKFDNLENSVVFGGVVYEALPEGASFSPAIKMTISYNPSLLPPGTPEESLVIAYHDPDKDLWITLDSEVDQDNNQVKATVSHFSKFAIVVGCGGSKEDQQTTELGYIYQAPCYVEGITGCPQWVIKKQDGSSLRSEDDVKKGKPNLQGQMPEDGPIYAPEGQTVKIFNEYKDISLGECKTGLTGAPADRYGYGKVSDAGSKKKGAKFTFKLQEKGNSCAKNAQFKIRCDDDCADFELNGKGAIKKEKEGNEYTLTFPADALRSKEDNTLAFTVINLYEACSGASGTFTLNGKGIFDKCPEGNDFLYKSCKCNDKNVQVSYDEEKLQKKPESKGAIEAQKPNDEQIKLLKDAVATRQYCINNNVKSHEQYEQEKRQTETSKGTFESLLKDDKQVIACCNTAEVYPQISSESGKEGCEAVVCKKGNQYLWAYTGNEIKESKTAQNKQKCTGTGGGRTAFLTAACGVKADQIKDQGKEGCNNCQYGCTNGKCNECSEDKGCNEGQVCNAQNKCEKTTTEKCKPETFESKCSDGIFSYCGYSEEKGYIKLTKNCECATHGYACKSDGCDSASLYKTKCSSDAAFKEACVFIEGAKIYAGYAWERVPCDNKKICSSTTTDPVAKQTAECFEKGKLPIDVAGCSQGNEKACNSQGNAVLCTGKGRGLLQEDCTGKACEKGECKTTESQGYDLEVTSITKDKENIYEGDKVKFTATVTNKGKAIPKGMPFNSRWLIDGNSVPSEKGGYQSYSQGLDKGGTQVFSFEWGAVIAGFERLIVHFEVNSEKNIVETDYDKNKRAIYVDVQAPGQNTCLPDESSFRMCKESPTCDEGWIGNKGLTCGRSDRECCQQKLSVKNNCIHDGIYKNLGDLVCDKSAFELSYAYKKCSQYTTFVLGKTQYFGWEFTRNRCKGCCTCKMGFSNTEGRVCNAIIEGETYKAGDTYRIPSLTNVGEISKKPENCFDICKQKAESIESNYCEIIINNNDFAAFDNSNSCTPTDVPKKKQ
ncbi:hypothetical protein HYU11_00880 [Candidatus Woesearchaeota archaeon]|nr:hypothetical protein [Candidatus Woesearchaeota archaeon]